MARIRERIKEIMLGEPYLAAVTTVSPEGKPGVRYVMAQSSSDLTIRFPTSIQGIDAEHFRRHPEVCVTCGDMKDCDSTECLHIRARAEITTQPEERKALWRDSLKTYFKGPDDPDYAVVVLKPLRIRYRDKKSRDSEELELGV